MASVDCEDEQDSTSHSCKQCVPKYTEDFSGIAQDTPLNVDYTHTRQVSPKRKWKH